jgi:copper chaperone CopZ
MLRMMLVFSLVTVLSASAAAQQTETGTLKVSGMHCGACAATVEKAAKKVDGVTAVKASQPEGTATVTFDSVKTTLEAVAKAINRETPFKAQVPKTSPKK